MWCNYTTKCKKTYRKVQFHYYIDIKCETVYNVYNVSEVQSVVIELVQN